MRRPSRKTLNSWPYPEHRAIPDDPAAYWPDTCFLELPQLPLTFQELDRLSPDGRDAPPSIGEYYALVQHEHTHWIQAHAFSYGRFLAHIEQARAEITESLFVLVGATTVNALLARRAKGHAIVRLGKQLQPLVTENLGPVASRLQRHWWGLWLLRRELDRAPADIPLLQSTRFRLGLATLYAVAGPDVSTVALVSDEALQAAAFAYTPDAEFSRSASVVGPYVLHSAALTECAAVLNQHWLYAYYSEWHRRHGDQQTSDRYWDRLDRSWTRKEPTYYADAFAVFRYLNPSADLNESTPLATLGVLCCVALDGLSPIEGTTRLRRWEDFYPPARFIALARAVNRVGMLPSHTVCALEPSAYWNYVSKLCEEAAVEPPTLYAAAGPSPRWASSPVNDLRRLHHDAAGAAATLMRDCPASLVAPCEAGVYLSERIASDDVQSCRLAFDAPLMILGGRAAQSALSQRFFHCAVAGIYQRMMLSLVGECGTLPAAGRPSCEDGQKMEKTARELAQRRLEIAFSS